jgi:hypothetical protein
MVDTCLKLTFVRSLIMSQNQIRRTGVTPLKRGDAHLDKMSEGFDRNRRCFSSTLAMTLAGAQFGLVRGAKAQSKTPGPPAVKAGEFFPGFSTELIKTSGTTIHVLRKGTGRPLLLHGYPETHLTWRKVAPQLADQFSVIVPDLRGYGESGKPQDGKRHENYSFRAMAQDQVDVMRHYGHERFLVAAHDRGARVAHRLCLDHPDSVEKAASRAMSSELATKLLRLTHSAYRIPRVGAYREPSGDAARPGVEHLEFRERLPQDVSQITLLLTHAIIVGVCTERVVPCCFSPPSLDLPSPANRRPATYRCNRAWVTWD